MLSMILVWLAEEVVCHASFFTGLVENAKTRAVVKGRLFAGGMKSKLLAYAMLLGVGIEGFWYVWSTVRRRRILGSLVSHWVRKGCSTINHKPLSLVCVVHIVVAMWRAWMRYSTGATVHTVVVNARKGCYGNIWVWRPSRSGAAIDDGHVPSATPQESVEASESSEASDGASASDSLDIYDGGLSECGGASEGFEEPQNMRRNGKEPAHSPLPGHRATLHAALPAQRPQRPQQLHQHQRRVQQPPLVVFPGAGFGAVPYARFLKTVAEQLHTTVVCIEDPSTFAGHHLGTANHLTMRGWSYMYLMACRLVCTSPNPSQLTRTSLNANSSHTAVDVWSHSNGSFIAASICHMAAIPPRRAVFYEPTAVQDDWCPMYATAGKSLMQRFTTWMIAQDECTVKLVVAVQDPSRPDALCRRTSLLTMPLRPGVQYTVDTADADRMLNTAETRQRIPLTHHARIRWRSHSGGHADQVVLCDQATANASARDLCIQLARPWARGARALRPPPLSPMEG